MIYRFLRYFLVAALTIYISSCGSDDSTDPAPTPQVDCTTLTISMTSSTSAGCTSLGSVEVSATGGMSPYTFALDGGAFQSSAVFMELEDGAYQITAKDANDCTDVLNVTIEEESNDFSVTVSQNAPSGCLTEEGELEVTVDGSGTYEFSINGGDFGSSAVFSGLNSQLYEIVTRDEDGCTTTASAPVLTGVALATDVMPIIDTNCALPTCHGGSQFPDFRVKTNIINNSASIVSRTIAGSMPPAGRLDDALINTIACWVADGAPDN